MILSPFNHTAVDVKEDQPSISVVIPAYNAGKFINAAIDSVLAQTLPPLEIIVIDDGSTDDTREQLRVYGQRIRYYFQKNAGIGAARNAGIRAATGDWIALLDADDIWHPRKLEYQAAVIGQNPNVALIGTNNCDIDRKVTELVATVPEPTEIKFEMIQLRRLLKETVFCPSSVLIRKSILEMVGGFSVLVQGSEDMLMWWTIAAVYPVIKVQEMLIGYRVHPTSISNKFQTMIASKKRALSIAIQTLPPLQQHLWLRGLARARVYRETSWELHSAGDHFGATADILISIMSYPFALHSNPSGKLRLDRTKRLCRYILSAGHNWIFCLKLSIWR